MGYIIIGIVSAILIYLAFKKGYFYGFQAGKVSGIVEQHNYHKK